MMEQLSFHICNSGIEETVSFSRREIEEVYLPLLRHLTQVQKEKGRRILVFLAAPPGAGKTTLVQFLEYLSRKEAGLTPVTGIGMDGFHHYQNYLRSHSLMRDGKEICMVKVKGAPQTFDLPLLTERIRMVAEGEECGWPNYDRALHNPVENAIWVTGDIVLLEGNYLLLDWEGWKDLRRYADYTIRIVVDEALLRRRLIARKISTGASREEAEAFVDFSDAYNVRTCLEHTMQADLTLRADPARQIGLSVQSD